MTEYMTPQEFADKADYEGGLLDGIFGYGLSHQNIDPDEHPELHSALRNLREVALPAIRAVENLLPEPEGW